MPLWNREAALAMLAGDAGLLGEMLVEIRLEIPRQLDLLARAGAAGDADAAHRACHTLKGLAGQLQAEALQAEALACETLAKAADWAGLKAREQALRRGAEALVDELAQA